MEACEREKDWIQSTQSGKCLKYYNEERTWDFARKNCSDAGGDLVKVLDSAMNEFLAGLVNFLIATSIVV